MPSDAAALLAVGIIAGAVLMTIPLSFGSGPLESVAAVAVSTLFTLFAWMLIPEAAAGVLR